MKHQKHETTKKKSSVHAPTNIKGEDLDKNDGGVDYRATDISRPDRSGKGFARGFAGDDRINLREDYKRKYGNSDEPAKYYVDYTDKDTEGDKKDNKKNEEK